MKEEEEKLKSFFLHETSAYPNQQMFVDSILAQIDGARAIQPVKVEDIRSQMATQNYTSQTLGSARDAGSPSASVNSFQSLLN